MNKEIYLIGGTAGESHADFRSRMLEAATVAAGECHPSEMWLTLTESPPPALSVIPFKKGKVAAFTILRENVNDQVSRELTGLAGFRSAYHVEEAVPVSYTRDWPDGTVTPGICLLTLFRQKPGITRDVFTDRWFNSHTPLSLRIHPLWHYNRNVVTATIASAETPMDGIVEEHFRVRKDLLNPFRFFGNPLVIIPRMIEVYRDTAAFLDYGTIEPWLAREFHICGR